MIALQKTPSGAFFLHIRTGETSYLVETDRHELVHRYWGRALPFDMPGEAERELLDDARPMPYSVERQSADEFLARPDVAGRRQARARGEESGTISGSALSGSEDALQSAQDSPPATPHPESVMSLRREYPDAMRGDTRVPALELRFADGTRVSNLRVESAETAGGLPVLEGLPCLHAETGEHARITLFDSLHGVRVHLYYAVPDERSGIIARHVEIENISEDEVDVLSVASASVDLPAHDREAVHLAGAWARERAPVRRPVARSRISISSRRGASGHEHAPFLALCEEGAGERHGEVHAMTLLYSGNHRFLAAQDGHEVTRFSASINPEGFTWRLSAGERFVSPQAVLAYSSEGFTPLSHRLHDCARRFVIDPRFHEHQPQVVLNSWEAVYFDVDHDAVVALAPHAKKIGAEVLVIDDGWFTGRDNDRGGLGDWQVHTGKFPQGLRATREAVAGYGLELGIWMEPEMVSPASELYGRHPEWVFGDGRASGTPALTSRNQLTLDLSRLEVQEWMVEQISRVIDESGATYLKWDMNRPFSGEASGALGAADQGESMHRYILGLYRVLGELAKRQPQLVIEGCAGGGGRFDFGMLAFVPQYWTSDNTDAADRVRIQSGSSLFLPPETMGAHVSVVPNHQTGRVTPVESRVAVAMFGAFGFELDPASVSEQERAAYALASERYRRVRGRLRRARFYRLTQADAEYHAGFAAVSADRRHALVLAATLRSVPDPPVRRVYVPGLVPDLEYRDVDRGTVWRGAALERFGLRYPAGRGDWVFDLYELEAV